jgi:hypothetical protein
MRIAPDDEVFRAKKVWLGPTGMTFPWTARYLAYATWLVTFLAVLLAEAITPLHVGIPPIWEICTTTLITYAAMGFVDHEKPPRGVLMTFLVELGAPRPGKRKRIAYRARWRCVTGARNPRLATRAAVLGRAVLTGAEVRSHRG